MPRLHVYLWVDSWRCSCPSSRSRGNKPPEAQVPPRAGSSAAGVTETAPDAAPLPAITGRGVAPATGLPSAGGLTTGSPRLDPLGLVAGQSAWQLEARAQVVSESVEEMAWALRAQLAALTGVPGLLPWVWGVETALVRFPLDADGHQARHRSARHWRTMSGPRHRTASSAPGRCAGPAAVGWTAVRHHCCRRGGRQC
jgi:hypothetical protein